MTKIDSTDFHLAEFKTFTISYRNRFRKDLLITQKQSSIIAGTLVGDASMRATSGTITLEQALYKRQSLDWLFNELNGLRAAT